MTNANKKAATKKLAAATAQAWDALWAAFTAAKKAGDEGGALRAARRMVLWHRDAGLTPPAWLAEAAASE